MADLTGLQGQLDRDVQESSGEFVVLPAGKYQAVITGDELKPTSTGGQMLVLNLVVTEGPHTGATLVDRLNIINKSAKSQAIGQGTLRRICSLCKAEWPIRDTTAVYGRPMTVTVKVEEFESNKEKGKMLKNNKIASYGPADKTGGLAATTPASAPTSTGAAW